MICQILKSQYSIEFINQFQPLLIVQKEINKMVTSVII